MHVYHMRVRIGSMVALEVRETIGKTGHAKGPETLLFLYLKKKLFTRIICVFCRKYGGTRSARDNWKDGSRQRA